jgi:hypothetical protein
MLLALLAVCIAPAQTAHAQYPFWPRYGSFWGWHAPLRHKHQHRHRHGREHKEPRAAKTEQARDAPRGPLQIVVSIADQRIAVYRNGTLIARSSVSTGVPRHPTPVGIFTVIGKHRWHRSNLYSDAPMPYMQRITWSGIALHAGVLPGYPASHGCIRLKTDFAVQLWQLTRRGARVIIAPDEVRPLEIADPRLFAAKPKVPPDPPASAVPGSPAAAMDPAMMPAAAVQSASPLEVGAQQVSDRAAPAASPSAIARSNAAPISVFVSRKLGRLFVRQGSAALFDSPVSIKDPEEPLGTHVFTAMDVNDVGAALRWTVVSMPEELPRTLQASGRRPPASQIAKTGPASSSPDKARAALDRIEIPQDAVERIAERVAPGSSLIVSDHGVSKETGKGTDFIVLLP